jgi:hypothetical protein
MLLDDHSQGGYPNCVAWMASASRPPLAGNFPTVAITNMDSLNTPAGQFSGARSVCVIDFMKLRSITAGANFSMAVGSTAIASGNVPVRLRDVTDASLTSVDALLGNVMIRNESNPVFVGQVEIAPWDVGAGAGSGILTGPWSIGPGQQLVVQMDIVNSFLQVYFSGRYYGAT